MQNKNEGGPGNLRTLFEGLFPKDLDWTKWEPYYYYREFDVPIIQDRGAKGSIVIEEQPHLIYRVTHGIIGNVDDPETSGLFRDDQYAILFRDQRRPYMDTPIPAHLLFGSESHGGGNLALLFPILQAGSKTFNFEIVNLYPRTLEGDAQTYKVGICLHAMRDIGGTLEDRIS